MAEGLTVRAGRGASSGCAVSSSGCGCTVSRACATVSATSPAGVVCRGRGWVSQTTAAPAAATGHSTTPTAPSTPAPA
ncbi:hypothetical protein GTW54_26665 [Streptomyces sp. SID5468]|nr:hypothetical protein [Streptomyces sp. SID5468]